MTTDALRPYIAVLRTRFALILQYRAAALAGFGTQCWWGAIKLMVLAAFYRGAESLPMTFSQTVDYIWLGQAFLLLQPWGADLDVVTMVRSGDVALERLRPVDTYALWYARAMARRTANPFMRAIPMVITAGFLLPRFGLSKWALSPAIIRLRHHRDIYRELATLRRKWSRNRSPWVSAVPVLTLRLPASPGACAAGQSHSPAAPAGSHTIYAGPCKEISRSIHRRLGTEDSHTPFDTGATPAAAAGPKMDLLQMAPELLVV